MNERKTVTRPDITCPKSGEPIPLDKFSISKWSDSHYLVFCPSCRVMHKFVMRGFVPTVGGMEE